MTRIKLRCDGATARAEVAGELTAGAVGVRVEIALNDEWQGITPTFIARNGSTIIPMEIGMNGVTTVPHECMIAGGKLEIGVDGLSADGKVRIPTMWASCGRVRSSTAEGRRQGEEEPPTPGIVDQIKRDAKEAKDKAAEVWNAYHAGELKGKDGEPGRSPYIGDNKNWFIWDAAHERYMDTGVQAEGKGIEDQDDLQSLISGYVTPEMFGAVGDGETDDTAAMVAAINAAAKVVLIKNQYKIMAGFTAGFTQIVGKTLCGGGTIIGGEKISQIKIGKGTTVRDLKFTGLTLLVQAADILFENVTVEDSLGTAFELTSRATFDIHNVVYRNCKAIRAFAYGFCINASTYGGGREILISDIRYEGCMALECGKVGELAAGGGMVKGTGSTWAPGFCIEALSAASAGDNRAEYTYRVDNVKYVRCIAADSLESGFHIEKSTDCKAISYISCKAIGNGIRKYRASDKVLPTEQAVYTGDNTISYGAGFMLRKGARYIDCYSDGNYTDMWANDYQPLGGTERFAFDSWADTDITDGNGFNISKIFEANENVIFDSNALLQDGYPFLSFDKIHVGETADLEYNPMNIYRREKSAYQVIGNALVARNEDYNDAWDLNVAFHPIPIAAGCSYAITFNARAQRYAASLDSKTNVTFRLLIATYDKDMHRIAFTNNRVHAGYPSPNPMTFKVGGAGGMELAATARYLMFAFIITGVTGAEAHEYTAPVISGIRMVWETGSAQGSGAVSSVNGKTGAVVLTANDVGALPAGTKIPEDNSEEVKEIKDALDYLNDDLGALREALIGVDTAIIRLEAAV